MSKNDAPRTDSMQTLRKVLGIIGRYRLLLFASILLAALTVVLQLYVPILFGDAIDRIASTGSVDFAALGSILMKAGVLIAISSAGRLNFGLVKRMSFSEFIGTR